MTIQSLVKKTLTESKGFKAGKWRTELDNENFRLIHHGTPILFVNIHSREAKIMEGAWGSVSDKNGMNIALKIIGIDKKATSKGGRLRLEDV